MGQAGGSPSRKARSSESTLELGVLQPDGGATPVFSRERHPLPVFRRRLEQFISSGAPARNTTTSTSSRPVELGPCEMSLVAADGDEPIRYASTFDELIDKALDERERNYGVAVFEHHHLRRMRVADLARLYRDRGEYPVDRLPGVVDRAVDVKLQLYLTGEITPALVNHHYYARVNAQPSDADLVSVKLMLLSLHQDMITKSRILWERVMGLIYFIETGAADIPKSNKRSAKSTFFRMCSSTPRWKWLVPYEPGIQGYDDAFRTPEVHKRSALRGLLMRGDDLVAPSNELMRLLNDAMNQVWDNIQSIVSGGGVISLGGVHLVDPEDPISSDPFAEWGWKPE